MCSCYLFFIYFTLPSGSSVKLFYARSLFSEIPEFPPYLQPRQTRVLGGVA